MLAFMQPKGLGQSQACHSHTSTRAHQNTPSGRNTQERGCASGVVTTVRPQRALRDRLRSQQLFLSSLAAIHCLTQQVPQPYQEKIKLKGVPREVNNSA